jgi:drug/metabolite transporter (DMT)-like permease
MEDIFFNTEYVSVEHTLINVLIFIAITGILLFVLFFILSKVLFRKSHHRREITLRLTFLWTLILFFLLINIYFFFLLFINGFDKIMSTNWKFYLGILSLEIICAVIILFFFIKRRTLKQIINYNNLT